LDWYITEQRPDFSQHFVQDPVPALAVSAALEYDAKPCVAPILIQSCDSPCRTSLSKLLFLWYKMQRWLCLHCLEMALYTNKSFLALRVSASRLCVCACVFAWCFCACVCVFERVELSVMILIAIIISNGFLISLLWDVMCLHCSTRCFVCSCARTWFVCYTVTQGEEIATVPFATNRFNTIYYRPFPKKVSITKTHLSEFEYSIQQAAFHGSSRLLSAKCWVR